MFEIRSYTRDDRDAVIALIGPILEEHGLGHNLEKMERAVASWSPAPRSGFWVAHQRERLAGTVMILPKDQDTCELERLYLCADLRGRGLGQLLFDHAETFAREAGYTRLWLLSSRRFERAHRLYRKNGLRLIDSLDNEWEDDVFEKLLED